MKLTLLQTKTVEFRDVAHIRQLIKYHQDQLAKCTVNLDSPDTLPKVQAIAYNLIHLSRELERRNGRRAELKVFPGGKA